MVVPPIVQLSPTTTRPGRWCQELEGDPVYMYIYVYAITFIMCDMEHYVTLKEFQISTVCSQVSMCLGLYQSPISSASTCYSASVWNPHSKNENTEHDKPIQFIGILPSGELRPSRKITPTGSRNRALRHVPHYFFHDSPDVCGLHEKVVTVKHTRCL